MCYSPWSGYLEYLWSSIEMSWHLVNPQTHNSVRPNANTSRPLKVEFQRKRTLITITKWYPQELRYPQGVRFQLPKHFLCSNYFNQFSIHFNQLNQLELRESFLRIFRVSLVYITAIIWNWETTHISDPKTDFSLKQKCWSTSSNL